LAVEPEEVPLLVGVMALGFGAVVVRRGASIWYGRRRARRTGAVWSGAADFELATLDRQPEPVAAAVALVPRRRGFIRRGRTHLAGVLTVDTDWLRWSPKRSFEVTPVDVDRWSLPMRDVTDLTVFRRGLGMGTATITTTRGPIVVSVQDLNGLARAVARARATGVS
jgi:hypothetical protein